MNNSRNTSYGTPSGMSGGMTSGTLNGTPSGTSNGTPSGTSNGTPSGTSNGVTSGVSNGMPSGSWSSGAVQNTQMQYQYQTWQPDPNGRNMTGNSVGQGYTRNTGTQGYSTNGGTQWYGTNGGTQGYSTNGGTQGYSTNGGTQWYGTNGGTQGYGMSNGTQGSGTQNRQSFQNPQYAAYQQPPRNGGTQNYRPQNTQSFGSAGAAGTNPQNGRTAVRGNQNGSTQTDRTTQRRTVQGNAQNKKITLTPEQAEINRANREREKYYHKKQRSRFFKTLWIRFLVFLVVFAIMAGMVTALLFYQLTKQDPVDVSGYSYKIGDGSTYTLRYADAVHEGHIYISFTDIANLCGMAMVGSTEDMKYVIIGDETETIRFLTDTRVVYVNGVETRLPSSCYYKNEKLYVPLDFVDSYCKGLEVEVNTSTHRVTVQRILLNGNEKGVVPKGEIPQYDTLSFLLASPSPMTGITEETAKSFIKTPDMGFIENLSSYEEYMNPGNTTEYLTLVNVNHLLDSGYVPQDMLTVSATRDDGRALQQMRTYAAKSLEAMFREMRANGITDVSVTSAYRSYSYQKALFDERLVQFANLGTEGAYKAASEIVNPPGGSEHQTGLCCDMHNLVSADISFAKEPAYQWLKENCWKFGFILRYPEDKVNITGISYEPWHYRYVGRYHAQKMTELGMCLEEYWAYLGYN